MRDVVVGMALAMCVLGALAVIGCTINRVVLYETINYPAPEPT